MREFFRWEHDIPFARDLPREEVGAWMQERDSRNPLDQPVAVYEMHLGSWMHASADAPYIEPDGTPRPPVPAADLKPGARLLTYPELADRVIPYVKARG